MQKFAFCRWCAHSLSPKWLVSVYQSIDLQLAYQNGGGPFIMTYVLSCPQFVSVFSGFLFLSLVSLFFCHFHVPLVAVPFDSISCPMKNMHPNFWQFWLLCIICSHKLLFTLCMNFTMNGPTEMAHRPIGKIMVPLTYIKIKLGWIKFWPLL